MNTRSLCKELYGISTVLINGVLRYSITAVTLTLQLGKQLASAILPELQDDKCVANHDSSTNGLINYFKSQSRL